MPQLPQERIAHEEQRILSIKEYIDYLAFLFSRDHPDVKEDMAQEAREAVLKRLRQAPDCPISHLKVKAKSAVLNYRGQGSSVDGKLNQSHRPRQYNFTDINQVVTEEGTTLADTLTDQRMVTLRITEEQALHRVLVDQIQNKLTAEETQALTLRLCGVSWSQIKRDFGYGDGRMTTIRNRIKTAATQVLNPYAAEHSKNGR
jgi:hypothetical protein